MNALMSHLQVEQNRSDPHGLADLQAVGGQGEPRWALVVGWQNLNVHRGDGAPGKEESTQVQRERPCPSQPVESPGAAASCVGKKVHTRVSWCAWRSAMEKQRLGGRAKRFYFSGMVYYWAKVQLLPDRRIHGYRWKCLSCSKGKMSARGFYFYFFFTGDSYSFKRKASRPCFFQTFSSLCRMEKRTSAN